MPHGWEEAGLGRAAWPTEGGGSPGAPAAAGPASPTGPELRAPVLPARMILGTPKFFFVCFFVFKLQLLKK